MDNKITFSDAKTVELWLPKAVASKIKPEVTCIQIVTTKKKQDYFLNGELAHTMELETMEKSDD